MKRNTKFIISILSLIILFTYFINSLNNFINNIDFVINSWTISDFCIWLVANIFLVSIIYGNIKLIFAIKNNSNKNEIISVKIMKYGIIMIFLSAIAIST